MTKKVNYDDLFVSSMLDAIVEFYCKFEDMRDSIASHTYTYVYNITGLKNGK